MTQLGILTTEFERPTLDETLDAVVAHGIRAVQFQLGSALPAIPIAQSLTMGLDVLGPHLTDELFGEIRAALEGRQLTMAAVDGTFNMIDVDEERRHRNLRYLQRVIGACDVLQTSVVTLCTGSRGANMWQRHPDNDSPEAWADLVETMSLAAETAERHGVDLAFEPEVNNVVNSAKRARQLIDDVSSPAVKVLMDPANIFQAGELPEMEAKLNEAFTLLSGDIGLAHAKDLDHDGEAGHLGAGRGLLDYTLYLALLAESGFEGSLILHQVRGLTDLEIDECFAYVAERAPAGFLRQPG